MARHLLSEREVRTAKPGKKPYRKHDGDGLALRVAPSGARSWQLRYRLDGGEEQTATLGKYPTLTLAGARDEADKKRALIARGEHLTTVKRRERLKRKTEALSTFKALADAWVAREARRQNWTAHYRVEVEASIRNHLGALLRLPIVDITAPILGPLLIRVEARAPHMLEKIRPRLTGIIFYAIEQGLLTHNPLPPIRRGRAIKRRHYPAVTTLPGVGDILRAARAADPCKGIRRAHTLAAFTALRISEVVGAKWEEFELDGVDVPIAEGEQQRYAFDREAGNWNVPRSRMKNKDADRGPHVVPLPPVLLATLREWRKEDGLGADYVCPAPRDPRKPLTVEAVEKHYREKLALAGKHSPHSWRAAFSTICRDAGKDGDTIEAQCDRITGNRTQSAYDRAKRLELRRALMRWYEAQLIAARDGATVLPLKRRA
jgi:integrase